MPANIKAESSSATTATKADLLALPRASRYPLHSTTHVSINERRDFSTHADRALYPA